MTNVMNLKSNIAGMTIREKNQPNIQTVSILQCLWTLVDRFCIEYEKREL